MNAKERRELAISEIVLIVLAVVGVGVVVWLAWARPLHKVPNVINSFAECKAAKGIIQNSYPEVCVTTDGKRFINPDQKVELPAASNTDQSTDVTARKKLTIKEWKVAFPYPDSVHSLSYAPPDAAGVATITFDDIPGSCKGSVMLRRALEDQDLDGNGRTAAQLREQLGATTVKQLGNYYYVFAPGNDGSGAACSTDDATSQRIHTILNDFSGAKIQQLVLAQ